MSMKRKQFCRQLSKREQIWAEPQGDDHNDDIGEVQCGPAFSVPFIIVVAVTRMLIMNEKF